VWTNRANQWAVNLTTTNSCGFDMGLHGGASWGNINGDPSEGIYLRWNSTVEAQLKFAFIVKKSGTTTTNYMVAADTAWHDVVFYNDTGVTNVVRCSMDGGAPISVTNLLGTAGLGAQVNCWTKGGGITPAVDLDYYDFGIIGITQ
jgi:hypothetical protein